LGSFVAAQNDVMIRYICFIFLSLLLLIYSSAASSNESTWILLNGGKSERIIWTICKLREFPTSNMKGVSGYHSAELLLKGLFPNPLVLVSQCKISVNDQSSLFSRDTPYSPRQVFEAIIKYLNIDGGGQFGLDLQQPFAYANQSYNDRYIELPLIVSISNQSENVRLSRLVSLSNLLFAPMNEGSLPEKNPLPISKLTPEDAPDKIESYWKSKLLPAISVDKVSLYKDLGILIFEIPKSEDNAFIERIRILGESRN
jgi:hypothetical protein